MLRSKFAKRLAISILCAAFSATAAAAGQQSSETSGDCAASSTTPPAASDSTVNLPDYNASAPNASDAEVLAEEQAEQAARTEWANYVTSVLDTLSRSSDPRDWAFATMADHLHFTVWEAP